MPYEIFLALRYLRAGRGRRGAAQLTALAALVGIACGVAALVVAMALANGFRDELQDKILRGTAHLTAMRADNQPVDGWREAVGKLRGVEGIVDATATTYAGALLSGADGAAYTVVRGVDAESPRALAEIRRTLLQGSVESLFHRAKTASPLTGQSSSGQSLPDQSLPDQALPGQALRDQAGRETEAGASSSSTGGDDDAPVEAIVGVELAARTGLRRVGDEGWMATGERIAVAPGFVPRARRVRVAGIFRTGLYDYDASWIYVALDTAGDVGGMAARSPVISIEVADIYETEATATRVRHALGAGWTTVDWREANRPLFAALSLERRTVALIIGLIMLVASLNITATLVLLVVERRGDIAILSALGARAPSIMAIFVVEGAIIGAVGALTGVAFGLLACALANHFELVTLPADVYSLAAVVLRPSARDVALTALAAFVISLLATLYPARVAARLRPATVLRYE